MGLEDSYPFSRSCDDVEAVVRRLDVHPLMERHQTSVVFICNKSAIITKVQGEEERAAFFFANLTTCAFLSQRDQTLLPTALNLHQ